jgi:hypothetical protein
LVRALLCGLRVSAQSLAVDDIPRILKSVPRVLPDMLLNFVPYALVLIGFAGFLYWNGGIVLGALFTM